MPAKIVMTIRPEGLVVSAHGSSSDRLIAQAAAERIVEALKWGYTITPKAPRPLAPASSLPKMGLDR
jgi:hypothetical protein